MTPRPTQQANEVTTEPQRRALEEMSRKLSRRLEGMINEQNKRARDFIEQRHSLSPLPGIQIPGLTSPQAVAQPPEPKPAPFPPPVVPQQPVSRQCVSDAPPLPFEIPHPESKKGTAGKEKSEGSKGWVFALVTFLLFILIRSCN